MGQPLDPRVIRGGEFIPTAPRSGSLGDSIFRVENMVLRGRGFHRYWECYGGQRDLNAEAPLVALTGTVAVTAGSPIVTGTGTRFLTELFIGQYVLIIDNAGDRTIPIFVKDVFSDTEYEAWRPSTVNLSGQIGWRMQVMGEINNDFYTMLWGSVLKLDKGSYLSVGDGIVRVNGQGLQGASLTARREPQISILNPTTQNYLNYILGMAMPVPPLLAAVPGGTKGMQGGNYSLVITPHRTQTRGYNNPSLRADVTIATGDMIEITFPAMDTANGQDAWGIWVTTFADSLGADLNYLNGPWHFYVMLDSTQVSPLGGTFNIEYYDAEVETQEVVSFNNDPPPQAVFVSLLNFTPTWISCRGAGFETDLGSGPVTIIDPSPGPFIAPAKPRNIEAAPIDVQFSSSPPETIIGAVSAQGRVYLLTRNYLQIAQSTPDQNVPILIRPFWRDGFAHPNALIFHNGNLYAYTLGGPARSASEGDPMEAEKDWAAYVSEITDLWTAGHAMTAYSPSKDAICFFHAADALNENGFWTTRVLLYGIPQQQWIGNVRLSQPDRDSIVSGVATVGERLMFTMGGRTQLLPSAAFTLPMSQWSATGSVGQVPDVEGASVLTVPALEWSATGEVVTP